MSLTIGADKPARPSQSAQAVSDRDVVHDLS